MPEDKNKPLPTDSVHVKRHKEFVADSTNLVNAVNTHKAMVARFPGTSPMGVMGKPGEDWQAAIDTINTVSSRMHKNHTLKGALGIE